MDKHFPAIEQIVMPFEQWLKIEEPFFFTHRSTAHTAPWQAIDSVAALSVYMTTVAVIRVNHAKLYKLNGWQRLQSWTEGTLTAPDSIMATIYDISQTEFDDLCARLYREQLAQLPPHEYVIALYKELELSFRSERLSQGFITEAMNIALRGKPRAQQDKRSLREKQDIDLKKAIVSLKEELLALDRLKLKPDLFLTGVLAGSLIMIGIDPSHLEFFQRLNRLDGKVSEDGLTDPVEALLSVIDSVKNKRMTQVRMQQELCGKTVKAVLLWKQGPNSPKYWTKNALRMADYQPYIRELKRLKGIHEERDL